MTDLDVSLIDILQQVSDAGKILTDHLQERNLPPLSLKANASPFFPGTGPPDIDPSPRLDDSINAARFKLLESARLLSQLVAGPAEAFMDMLNGRHTGACLQYVYHFRLADHVPVNGDISYKDLAETSGTDANQCSRVLKYLSIQNFFRHSRPGHVAHTAMSKLLLQPDFRDALGWLTEESFVAASHLAVAAEKYPGSQEKNQTPWNVGHGVDVPVFEFFENHPARLQRFMGTMRFLASKDNDSMGNYLDAVDWKAIGQGLVVDVGGSFGHCSFEIAEAAPELQIIVQDLENVVAQAQKETEGHKHVERVKFQANNFFTAQPVNHADVYFLRMICHDYPDKYAAQILNHITSAMGPKSRIVIVDAVMPEPGVLNRIEEERARFFDMEMLLGFNSLERDEEGWHSLVQQADPRLEIRKITKTPGKVHAVLEIGWKEN